MSESPLSDVMAEHTQSRSADSYGRFLGLFRISTIGIVAIGPAGPDPDGTVIADGLLSAGMTTHGDGLARLLAYADPLVARRNFGPRFNAGLTGDVLLRMAASSPGCEGILVNSAVSEISLVITRITAESLVAGHAPGTL